MPTLTGGWLLWACAHCAPSATSVDAIVVHSHFLLDVLNMLSPPFNGCYFSFGVLLRVRFESALIDPALIPIRIGTAV
jgi:hypothetical protein